MSINASIKTGKAMDDTSGRLTNIVSSSSRQRRENILKKKRAAAQMPNSSPVENNAFDMNEVIVSWNNLIV